MSSFCFYHGDDPAVADRLRSEAASVWGDIKEVAGDSFWLFVASADYARSVAQSRAALGAVSGYVRCDRLEGRLDEDESPDGCHNREFINVVIDDDGWPLGGDWTGSFGAVGYSKAKREVIVCNDPVGYIPIYYSAGGEGVLGGTSLIVLSRSIDCEPDTVGVLERISAPYCNYGRRTLIRQISRVLPGERVRFSRNGSRVTSAFDNELCKGLIDSNADEAARIVWDTLQRETNLALEGEERICVALSGGWDSRLALASVSDRAESINCLTFGNESLHEVRTARRCADTLGARHEFFPIEDSYFPPRGFYESLIEKIETANQLQWCTIIDAVKNDGPSKDVLLMGDLCESIVALNMRQFSTRDARIRSFMKGLFGQGDQIAPATGEGFARWKEAKRAQVTGSILRNIDKLSSELADGCKESLIAEEIESDLDLCFSRVRDNEPRFAPMFEELFNWFHRARFLIAGQAIFLSSRFRPLCPAISMRFMRLITRVHPRLRIRRRLMNAIARLPEFDALAAVPSTQIPWLSARAPALLREMVWGARSGIDQALIRRAMKHRDPKMRHRVLPALDYVKEYQRENAVPNVQSWFSEKWLNGDKYVEIVRRRASLEAWPLMNLDVAGPANVSIILDLCGLDQRLAERAPVMHEVELI